MQLRDYLPKTLFGRMLSIILVPMILVQVITIFIFYERHWDTVTRHMASQLAAEIELLADRLGSNPDKGHYRPHPDNRLAIFFLPRAAQSRRRLSRTQ